MRIFILAAIASTFATVYSQTLPTPPLQPTAGPGGSDYAFGNAQMMGPYAQGASPALVYTILQPTDPTPSTAPVILFLHAYQANKPTSYWYWLQHMARMGFTVVWVEFDSSIAAQDMILAATHSWAAALTQIETQSGFVRPMLDSSGVPVTALVGHSAGAYLTLPIASASTASANGIPVPKAVIAIEPGQGQLPTYDISAVSAGTYLVMVAGDQDKEDRWCIASTLWADVPQIPASNRDFLFVVSDSHGSPAQLGNHYFPLTSTSLDDDPNPKYAVDDRDYNITWKLSVGAANCAIFGTDCQYGLGHGSTEQTGMGAWSDGVAVTPLKWIADPATFFSGCP